MSNKEQQEREAVVKRLGSLEIEEDMRYQERLWKIQRYLRGIGIVILLLALTGVLGGGPLSRAHLNEGGCLVEYDRIAYRETSSFIRIKCAAEKAAAGRLSIAMENKWLDLAPEQVTPAPIETRLSPDRIIFEFLAAYGQGAPVEVQFRMRPATFGLSKFRLEISQSGMFTVTQFILP